MNMFKQYPTKLTRAQWELPLPLCNAEGTPLAYHNRLDALNPFRSSPDT